MVRKFREVIHLSIFFYVMAKKKQATTKAFITICLSFFSFFRQALNQCPYLSFAILLKYFCFWESTNLEHSKQLRNHLLFEMFLFILLRNLFRLKLKPFFRQYLFKFFFETDTKQRDLYSLADGRHSKKAFKNGQRGITQKKHVHSFFFRSKVQTKSCCWKSFLI